MHRSGFVIVFLISFLVLSYNIQNVGVASGIIDPLGTVGAQDEAIYGSESIQMALHGGLLTQRFLGRWELSKPPLLMWMTTGAIKMFGIHRVSLRTSALLCGAALAAFLFWTGVGIRSIGAALVGMLLAIGNPLVHVLSRRNLTDVVVAAAAVAAFAFIVRDPLLRKGSSVAAAGIALSASILAKSFLGVLPLMAFLLAAVVWNREDRPPPSRLVMVGTIAVLPAALWFAYEYVAHVDYLLGELRVIFGQSAGLRPQTSQESQAGFYAARVARVDPLMTLLALSGVAGLWRSLCRREPAAVLIVCWIGVFTVALLMFRFRSASYLLPAIPPFILVAMCWCPLLSRPIPGKGIGVACLLVLAFGFKVMHAQQPWGLHYEGSEAPTAALLSRYCEMQRNTDLFIFEPIDQLYASTLPLARVRYVWVDQAGLIFQLQSHLHDLGILLSAEEFRKRFHADYEPRLRRAGLPDNSALGTGIALRDVSELQRLFGDNPQSDYLIPEERLFREFANTHEKKPASDGRILLLARHPSGQYAVPTGWSCRL